MRVLSWFKHTIGLIQMASWTSNSSAKQHYDDLNVNELETYGSHSLGNTHGFGN